MQLFHGSLQFNQQCTFSPGPLEAVVYMVDDNSNRQQLSIGINGKHSGKVLPGKTWTVQLKDQDSLTILATSDDGKPANGAAKVRYVVATDAVSTIQQKTEMRLEVAKT